jgi:hypothetical protein
MRGFGAKQPFLCQFLNEGFLQETYLTKQMQRPHILLLQVSKSTYLFPVSWEIKYAPYLENTHYISCGGGGEAP